MRKLTAGDCSAAVDVAIIMGKGAIDFQQMALFLNDAMAESGGPIVHTVSEPLLPLSEFFQRMEA